MNEISLNTEAIHDLLKTRFRGRITDLLQAWTLQYDTSPDRSTLYRWLDGTTLPRTANSYCQLCGLLDVDPFFLINYDQLSVEQYHKLVEAIVSQRWAPFPMIAFVQNFTSSRAHWPPESFARTYYDRGWHTSDFNHDGVKKNYYQTIEITSSLPNKHPVVYHFSFRRVRPFGVLWNHYGFVSRNGDTHAMFHVNGFADSFVSNELEWNKVVAETWFGQGKICFRVASIHPFHLILAEQSTEQKKVLRFSA